MGQMLVGGDVYRLSGRHLKGKDVLDIVRDARGVAVSPLGKDLEGVGDVPILEFIGRGRDSGFLFHLAASGFAEPLSVFLAAGNRLPVARVRCAFKEQYVERWRVDDDKDGYRALESGHQEFASSK